MIPPPVATLLAQAASPSAGEVDACGAADKASSLCRAIYRATGNQFLASTADTVIVKAAKLLLILALALVVNRLIARSIKRFVRSVKGEKGSAWAATSAMANASAAGVRLWNDRPHTEVAEDVVARRLGCASTTAAARETPVHKEPLRRRTCPSAAALALERPMADARGDWRPNAPRGPGPRQGNG